MILMPYWRMPLSLLYKSALRDAIDTTDIAFFTLPRASGKYDVYVGYFDEEDEVANLQVNVPGALIAAWRLGKEPARVGEGEEAGA